MNDHERGCQGREYTCTCGYDADRDALIETLVKALEAAQFSSEELCQDQFEGNECWVTLNTIRFALARAKLEGF